MKANKEYIKAELEKASLMADEVSIQFEHLEKLLKDEEYNPFIKAIRELKEKSSSVFDMSEFALYLLQKEKTL